jgi:predicted nucleotidyltransferase
LLKLGLFGSFAREEANECSDLDIIIELEPGTQDIFEIKQALRSTLEHRFNRNVDISREKAIRPIFRTMILNEAIYIKDRLILQQMIETIDKIGLYSSDFATAESFVNDSKSYRNIIALFRSVLHS